MRLVIFIVEINNYYSSTINNFGLAMEGITVFTYPYLSAEAPVFGEIKGLIEQLLNISR